MEKNNSLYYFCKNIQILRSMNHLSLKEMAQLTGIGTASLSKLERGNLPPRLSTDFVFAVAGRFQLPADALFLPFPGMEERY